MVSISSYTWQFILIWTIIAFVEWLIFRKRLDISFLWVVLTPLGLVIGYLLGYALGQPLQIRNTFGYIMVIGACIGAGLGLAQFLVLRKSYKRALLWVFASIAGFAIPVFFAQNGWISIRSIVFAGPPYLPGASVPLWTHALVFFITYAFCTGLAFTLLKKRWSIT